MFRMFSKLQRTRFYGTMLQIHMHILKRQFRDIPLLKFRKQNNKNQLTTNLPLG